MERLVNQHGPAHAATADDELVDAVGHLLAPLGGERFLTPEAGREADTWRLVSHGRTYDGPVVVVPGIPNACHDNADALAEASGGRLAVVYGYGLSDDGMWRCHSWCVDTDGTLVETTVERDVYFGVELGAEVS